MDWYSGISRLVKRIVLSLSIIAIGGVILVLISAVLLSIFSPAGILPFLLWV